MLAKLKTQGLKPVEPASKLELIRRATLDLTGLPPDPMKSMRSKKMILLTHLRKWSIVCSPPSTMVSVEVACGLMSPVTVSTAIAAWIRRAAVTIRIPTPMFIVTGRSCFQR